MVLSLGHRPSGNCSWPTQTWLYANQGFGLCQAGFRVGPRLGLNLLKLAGCPNKIETPYHIYGGTGLTTSWFESNSQEAVASNMHQGCKALCMVTPANKYILPSGIVTWSRIEPSIANMLKQRQWENEKIWNSIINEAQVFKKSYLAISTWVYKWSGTKTETKMAQVLHRMWSAL